MRIRTHPGEVLREEYLKPFGMSARALAMAIGIPPNRLTEIVRERRGVTADTAIRLGRYFGTDVRFWVNLQVAHDLSKAEAATDYSGVPTRADRARRTGSLTAEDRSAASAAKVPREGDQRRYLARLTRT